MSVQKYQQALEIIARAGGGDFDGPKSETLIGKAEAALGLSFPPSYHRFLLEMGCGNINGFEVFGLINDNFENSTIPNGIWLTLSERRVIALLPAYVLVGEGGDGTYYALDSRQIDGDGEAAVFRLSADGRQSDKVADSFGDYLFEAVQRVV